MARGLLTTTLAAVCAALGVAGCSGSTGTHVQTPGKSTPAPVSSSDPNTTAPPATTSVPRSTTTTTAAGFGAEQPAVDTYIKLVAASNAAFRDPQHVSLTLISSYTAGQAKLEYAQSLTAAKKQGIAYKGTPSTPRLSVVSSSLSGSLPSVVLRDCGLASTTDPFVGYYIATGKKVPTSTPEVPPPYAKTIKMFQPNRKSWVITSLTTDSTKTCEA